MLDRYPAKGTATPPAVVAPPRPTPVSPTLPPAARAPTSPNAVATPSPAPTPMGLISLDKPFDVDEFSQSLGETQVRVLVPREDLAEVLRRVMDFMGFGIYVYSVRIAPENSDTLRRFVVELQRVDYSTARRMWVPFEDKGRVDSPFGPGGSPA